MKLRLFREIKTEHSTTGKLFIDGDFECYTLEDKDRGLKSSMSLDEIKNKKVYGKTCIPTGTYEVITSYSGLFEKEMPLVLGVKGYDYIRIHPGNTENDTLGCILLGSNRTADFIGESRKAFNIFFSKMKAAMQRGEKITLTIE